MLDKPLRPTVVYNPLGVLKDWSRWGVWNSKIGTRMKIELEPFANAIGLRSRRERHPVLL